MNEMSVILLFCIVDDTLKSHYSKQLKDPKQELMSDAEIVLASIMAAWLFAGNLRRGLNYISERKYCTKILSESRFNRRLQGVHESFWPILQKKLAENAGAFEGNEFIIDSFPCSICHNIRIFRCRLAKGSEFRGYNASKKQYFYGLKTHMITSTTGVPISFELSPGSTHDLKAFKTMNMDAIEDGILYGDAAYNDYQLEDQLAKSGLEMIVDRKLNSKRPHPPEKQQNLKQKRRRIETCFSGILKLFPRSIHAVTLTGFSLKITLFVAAYTAFMN